jgi:hypothetical protein
MKPTKMNLLNIHGKLSRSEMKKIMAGSGSGSYKVGFCIMPGPQFCIHFEPSVSESECKAIVGPYCFGGEVLCAPTEGCPY